MAYQAYSLAPDKSEFDYTFPTQIDLTNYVYHFVKLDSNGLLVACGAGEKGIGILQDKVVATATAQKNARVRLGGLSKLKSGGSLTMGDLVKADGSAQGVTASSNKDYAIAKAVSTCASGDDVLVVIGAVVANV